MNRRELDKLIAQGEGISLEFKRCGNKPEHDVFETICSFANRQGGNLLLGVMDNGSIEGIDEQRVVLVERTIVNALNNPNLFSSAPTIEIERIDVGDNRRVLRLWVPMGPSVYRYNNSVFDRLADVDVRLQSDAQIAALTIRKQNYYSERRIYPWVTMSDLRLDLLDRVRDMAATIRDNHPWANMGNDELLHASRLISRDAQTGERGFNLAAIMLLGSDDLIFDVVPTYRTEALLRRSDHERYDDRLTVQTNLIESFDQLVAFCQKWLPDAFALDGSRRVSARDIIVRELVANSLMHREYSSPYLAMLEINSKNIKTRNASRSLYSGPITPSNLDPTPKNPVIASFFSQIGLAERLGSGTRNLYKYSRLYTGKMPELVDGDFFNAMVPLPDVAATQNASSMAATGISDSSSMAWAIVSFIDEHGPCSSSDILAELSQLSKRSLMRQLSELTSRGLIVREGKGRATRYRTA